MTHSMLTFSDLLCRSSTNDSLDETFHEDRSVSHRIKRYETRNISLAQVYSSGGELVDQ